MGLLDFSVGGGERLPHTVLGRDDSTIPGGQDQTRSPNRRWLIYTLFSTCEYEAGVPSVPFARVIQPCSKTTGHRCRQRRRHQAGLTQEPFWLVVRWKGTASSFWWTAVDALVDRLWQAGSGKAPSLASKAGALN